MTSKVRYCNLNFLRLREYCPKHTTWVTNDSVLNWW